ncbi:N-acetylmuramoyl-L-alanine amidase [Rasiella rasia]|uniref:N-acetylmuramoyl-L-alanine amidase n=1 Tax=Rasiella rasia TaxID=2744027 RepID=A0A6G6GJD4_9FLAO|nr:N-acetylmuramoyl-L-alanine amidase [Rasiella rasia]QIE58610.1 N-acetylmuramoyl-L-alanine amidase [Rasiella rasia]
MKIALRFAFAVFLLTAFAFTTSPEKNSKPIIVVIDVSHGGADPGNNNKLVLEKELVYQIAQKMATLNTSGSIQLHFTRDGDKSMSLQDRVKFINQLQPDAVLSLHMNGENIKKASGLRVFYSERAFQDKKTQNLASEIAESFKTNGLFSSRTIGSAPFYILKHSNAPALLLELGNMDNPSDLELVKDPAQQETIAQTILDALERL